jgi:hypothetical protein
MVDALLVNNETKTIRYYLMPVLRGRLSEDNASLPALHCRAPDECYFGSKANLAVSAE